MLDLRSSNISPGSNFYLLPVKEATVLPQFLSPFKRIEHHERRSILRKRGRSESVFSTPPHSPPELSPSEPRHAETSPRKVHHHIRKKSKLVQFSPYNRVQLISPRRTGDNEHIRKLYQSIQEGSHENSEDEEQEWSRTISQTSGSSEVCSASTPGESPLSSPN